ncbi:unnamed protein product [Orchesella dallaii]|uniref:Gustatory receptor n=1 Tax=Orchesella dallaii TaxID=48710 RepID=A0ABP1PYQ8_9HEXA
MPKTRRRSSFWTKELTSSPHRIEVATLNILQEQELNISADETDVGATENNGVGTSPDVLIPDSPTGTESKVANVLEDLENLGSSRTRAKHYLEHYFDFLHCLGLASFKAYWKDKITATFVMHQIPVCIFGVVTLITAFIKGIFGWVFSRYQSSLSESVLDGSFTMSLSLFVWTTNGTKFDEQASVLYGLYGETFSPTTVFFGCMKTAMDFFGELSDSVINDVMFISATTIYNLAIEFQLQMERNEKITDILKQYKQLQKVSTCIEEAFGGLFKLSHANNLLSCGYLVLILVSDIDYPIKTIFVILQIVKVEVACYLTIKASSVNKCFRQYVRDSIIDSETTDVDMKLTALAVLDESLESPIGLGSENFFIDETFVLKFATMVGTFSLFLIESERKSKLGFSPPSCNFEQVIAEMRRIIIFVLLAIFASFTSMHVALAAKRNKSSNAEELKENAMKALDRARG